MIKGLKCRHDQNANVTKVERQANTAGTTWQTIQYTYDILNNLKTVTDHLNRTTTYNYDGEENLISMVDAESNITFYQYDERNLLFKILDANTPQGVTQQDYDLNGNLSRLTDAKGNVTEYAYDGFDRLLTKTYDDLSTNQYAYDKNSNLTQFTPASNEPIQYVYDNLNRLTNKNFTLHTTLNAAYGYDVGSRLTSANTNASQVSYTYDNLNQVLSTTQTINGLTAKTLAYAYDDAGNRTQVVYPSNKTIDYTYDGVDQLTAIEVNSSSLANFTYDPLNRRATKSFSTTPTLDTTYTFDMANQLSTILNQVNGGGGISQYGYTYDNVGNRLTMTSGAGVHNYSYNDIYELIGVTGAQSHNYSYDSVGNRITADSVNYVTNSLNQYDSVGGTTITQDANGNLTDDGTNTYTYDEENRLSTADNTNHSASYAYDAFNRRVKKIVDGVAAYYVYDGDEVVAEYDNSGALAAEYVYGDLIDEVLTMDRGGNTYYYHYDGLGSVREITNSSGSLIEKYTYSPYGMPSIFDGGGNPLSSSAIDNPFMFTGRQWDEETGIYYYRARMYDPGLGRFLQRDPIGYWDSMNLYQYVDSVGKLPLYYVKPLNETNLYLYTANNPISRRDPLGLWYIDINVGWTSPWGVGPTRGWQFSQNGMYRYRGVNFGSPGPGFSMTFSGQNPTPGLNNAGGGYAIDIFAGGQAGYDKNGDWFFEGGLGLPGWNYQIIDVDDPSLWPWLRDKEPCGSSSSGH